ncbi:MAG: class I SAM-dependent methyltransferase [Saprospiraceae bacterium]|nr:class I SAM-dependent methyltransferase [Saprospiraceae bacterium]
MSPFRLEGMLEAMNDFVASQLLLKPDTGYKILDMGCGYGATVLHLLRNHPNVHFVGVANDEAQIMTARKQVHVGQAEFHVAEFDQVPYPDGSFDAIYGLESFCFAKDVSKEKIIAEAARLLKPDGKLVVVDGFLRKTGPLPHPISFLYKKNKAAWGFENLAALPTFIQTIENRNFTKIQVQDFSWKIAPSLLHIPRVCTRLIFAYFQKKDPVLLQYCSALLLTFLLSPFKMYFGYYAVTCRKSAVRLKN